MDTPFGAVNRIAFQSTATLRLPTPKKPPKSITAARRSGTVNDHIDNAAHVFVGGAAHREHRYLPRLTGCAGPLLGTCSGQDEGTYLNQTLAAITAKNWERITINTIAVLTLQPLGEKFLRGLASANGGTYTRITR